MIPQPATKLLVDGRLGHSGSGILMGLAFYHSAARLRQRRFIA